MKLKDLLNDESFLSKYGDYETVGNSYTAVRENDKLQLVFDVQKPKPKSVWNLKDGGQYYYTNIRGDVNLDVWCEGCQYEREVGNAFLTKEEAEKDVERRKVETMLLKHGGRRWYKKFGENFGFLIDDVDRFGIHSLNRIQGTIYFDTYSDAETALDSIGADRIKDALFEVR